MFIFKRVETRLSYIQKDVSHCSDPSITVFEWPVSVKSHPKVRSIRPLPQGVCSSFFLSFLLSLPFSISSSFSCLLTMQLDLMVSLSETLPLNERLLRNSLRELWCLSLSPHPNPSPSSIWHYVPDVRTVVPKRYHEGNTVVTLKLPCPSHYTWSGPVRQMTQQITGKLPST